MIYYNFFIYYNYVISRILQYSFTYILNTNNQCKDTNIFSNNIIILNILQTDLSTFLLYGVVLIFIACAQQVHLEADSEIDIFEIFDTSLNQKMTPKQGIYA